MTVDRVEGAPWWLGFGFLCLGLLVNALDLPSGVGGLVGGGLAIAGAVVMVVGARQQDELSGD